MRVPSRLLLLLTLAAVVLGAVWRWQHLATRPLHTDEAVQAWQTWQLLRGEGYRYDPVDRHGPWLYYGAAALERIRGGDATTFDDQRARTFVWLAGLLTLLLVAIAAHRLLGPLPAFFATSVLAAAPLAVLYHTYFVQEAWLTLFTWSLLFAVAAWQHRPRLGLAVAGGVCIGLMQVTKETSVLHFAALLFAGWFAPRFLFRQGTCALPGLSRRDTVRHLAAAGVAALVIYVAFYSGFGRHPGGVLDGMLTYLHQWQRAGDAEHTYPFLHYLRILLPHRAGGVRWGEPALLAFALGGAALALARPAAPALRLVALFTIALIGVYSLIPYKTPWLFLTPAVGLALLAGQGLAALARVHRRGLILAVVAGVATVAQLTNRTRLALERYPGDERNPYFYQQTPRGFTRAVDRVEELAAVSPAPLAIAVVSPDYAWPLPWYWRNYSQVGYYTTPPAASEPFDVLVWDSRLEPPESWPEGAMVELHGLRPNVILQLVIQEALWQRWEAAR